MASIAANVAAKPSLRSPDELMRPERLAALQPCRISASRALLGRAIRGRWQITRRHFDIDDKAKGHALYRIEADGWSFDFPIFSFEFNPKGRTGRIIGRSWDMMAALVEGPMSTADIATTAEELPKLYSPGHPHADAEGYVTMPNVKLPHEMVDMMTAARAYEANLKSLQIFRNMTEQSLSLLKGS